MIAAKIMDLIGAAKRLCHQCEELRARAERVMRHSETLHHSHATRRQFRETRRQASAR
jgi:hypothetical protein